MKRRKFEEYLRKIWRDWVTILLLQLWRIRIFLTLDLGSSSLLNNFSHLLMTPVLSLVQISLLTSKICKHLLFLLYCIFQRNLHGRVILFLWPLSYLVCSPSTGFSSQKSDTSLKYYSCLVISVIMSLPFSSPPGYYCSLALHHFLSGYWRSFLIRCYASTLSQFPIHSS